MASEREAREHEAGLRESEARLQALLDNIPGAIYRCSDDAGWTMQLITDEIERISGYPAADFVDNARRSYASVIHPDDRAAVVRGVTDGIEQHRPFALEYRLLHARGHVVWVLERGQLVPGEEGRAWIDGAIFDVTERRDAEVALRESEAERARHEEVRASRARIVEAGYAARRQLERDLHDGAQQSLVALALNLRLARSRAHTDPDGVVEVLDGALGELKLATQELRELARGLHPGVLTERGLGPALRGLADRSPVYVELFADVEERLPADVESAAYFVASEAMANVAKHARATGAEIRLTRERGRAVLEVADDGVGGVDLATGSGLRGLADRVAALGGELEVESPPGAGTRVRVAIPVA